MSAFALHAVSGRYAHALTDRILGMAGDPDGGPEGAKLRAFRRFVLLHGAVRSWLWFFLVGYIDPVGLAIAAGFLSLSFGLSLGPKTEHVAPRLAAPFLLLQLFWSFPFTPNHVFIEVLCVALLCLIDRDRPGDDALVLQGLQWLAAVILFQTGLQKILYGHYFQGDFLAFMVGVEDRFAEFFRLLLPAEEIARLQSYDPLHEGSGPYRVESLPFVLLSNAIVLVELVLPGLLMVRRTRRPAAIAAIAILLGIQFGAREGGFAFLFTNLLLLFLRTDMNRRLLPLFGAIYLYLLGVVSGVVPGWSLVEALNL